MSNLKQRPERKAKKPCSRPPKKLLRETGVAKIEGKGA